MSEAGLRTGAGPPPRERVFILGAGRAGRGLARALVASGAELAGLHGRRAEAWDPPITAGTIPPRVAEATTAIVAVQDAQLAAALEELLASPLGRDAVVLSVSGSAADTLLDPVRRTARPAGTFHPLLPLADPTMAPALLRGAWVGLAGDAAATAVGERLAALLGAQTLRIPEGERARYHAAAVFASNFPTVLAALAGRLLRDAGVPEDVAWGAVRRLLSAASANLETRGPEAALTGPVVRGDAETVRRHVEALASDPQVLAVYRDISLAAAELARRAGTPAERLDEVVRELSGWRPSATDRTPARPSAG